MPDFVSGLIGGGQLLGGLFGNKAADTQQDAANAGIATQNARYEDLRKLLMPFIQ